MSLMQLLTEKPERSHQSFSSFVQGLQFSLLLTLPTLGSNPKRSDVAVVSRARVYVHTQNGYSLAVAALFVALFSTTSGN